MLARIRDEATVVTGNGTGTGTGEFQVRTHRPEQAQAILTDRIARHRLRVLAVARDLDFTLRQARLGPVDFLRVRYGQDVEIRNPGVRDSYLLQLTLAGVCEIELPRGRTVEIGPGWLHVVNPGIAYRKRWSRDADQLIVRLPRRPLERLAGLDDSGRPIVFTRVAEPVSACVDDLVRYCWRQASATGGASSPLVDRSAGQHLMTTVLHALPNSATVIGMPDHLPGCLVRADGYIRRNLTGAVRVEDVAQAAGVGVRALEAAFRRHWRTTPSAHLRNLRLEAAHQLLSTPDRDLTVTDAAVAAGFRHLGRFAQSYARRFGELPSRTLRRATTQRS